MAEARVRTGFEDMSTFDPGEMTGFGQSVGNAEARIRRVVADAGVAGWLERREGAEALVGARTLDAELLGDILAREVNSVAVVETADSGAQFHDQLRSEDVRVAQSFRLCSR